MPEVSERSLYYDNATDVFQADNLCPAAATKSFVDSSSKGEYVSLHGGKFLAF